MKNTTFVEKSQFFRFYSLNVQGCNTLFGVLSSILLFKHRYPVGAKHPQGTEVCIKTFERLTICVWSGKGRAGVSYENTKKFRRACSVHAFFLVVVRDEERGRERGRERG